MKPGGEPVENLWKICGKRSGSQVESHGENLEKTNGQ